MNAFRYSADGLAAAWHHEDAFRQEMVLAAVMVPTELMLPVTLLERILLITVVIQVLIVEILNTAVEAAIDRQSFEINPLAKRAKDSGQCGGDAVAGARRRGLGLDPVGDVRPLIGRDHGARARR